LLERTLATLLAARISIIAAISALLITTISTIAVTSTVVATSTVVVTSGVSVDLLQKCVNISETLMRQSWGIDSTIRVPKYASGYFLSNKSIEAEVNARIRPFEQAFLPLILSCENADHRVKENLLVKGAHIRPPLFRIT
jgi:hypothetical protein